MKRLELAIESALFHSRWLLAPFFLGLILAIVALLIKFGTEVWELFNAVFGESQRSIIVAILSLVDITLVASLLLIIMLSGFENFVSKIVVAEHEDRPAWMGKVGF